MKRKDLSLPLAFVILTAIPAWAQESTTTQAAPAPVVTQGVSECTGFVSKTRLSGDLFVFDGADNDNNQPLRQWVAGDYVYLHIKGGAAPAVGAEYRLVRPGNEYFRTQWYPWQWRAISATGQLYQDAGRVRITKVTPQGAIAEIVFSCGPVYLRDLAIPFEPRPIPEYVQTTGIERFPQPTGKLIGRITAVESAEQYSGTGDIVYLNVGQADGAKSGQRYRVFCILRDRGEGIAIRKEPPRETIGEAIILTTDQKSSVAIVVSSLREITVGFGVELE